MGIWSLLSPALLSFTAHLTWARLCFCVQFGTNHAFIIGPPLWENYKLVWINNGTFLNSKLSSSWLVGYICKVQYDERDLPLNSAEKESTETRGLKNWLFWPKSSAFCGFDIELDRKAKQSLQPRSQHWHKRLQN